jgi:serine/threonine-protein kinase
MALAAGAKLGPYEILAPIGAGGMGEVYRARDPRMGREVAIKLSAERFSDRFEREVRAVAALNHPNICHIYDVGPNYLVLELVEGPTLAHRIKQSAIPLDEALPIARQIADALEAAHEKGIIHRDLKPANIKVKPDGTVKVLDFGLAKVAQASAGEDPEASPTVTLQGTVAGQLLGTPSYMAPEQARGKPVDRRADIWAFGVVLYEMLSGRRLFEGETTSDTLASVLAKEPDWGRIPPQVRRLLESCLEKDPKRRLRDIADAWRLLENAPAPTVSRLRPPWAVAAVLAFGLAIALWAPWRSAVRTVEQASVRLDFDLGPDASLGSGTGPSVILSPDGSRLVFVSGGQGATRHLFTRRLDQAKATPMPGTDGAYAPFFSPDGQWVGFFAQGKLKKTRIDGGEPVSLFDAPAGRGASWGEDGNIIAALDQQAGLSQVQQDGGKAVPVTQLNREAGESTHRWPQVLPGGKAVLFSSATVFGHFENADITILTLKDRRRKTVLQHAGMYSRYLPSGHLIYVTKGAILAVPFDLDRLEVRGTSVRLGEVASNPNLGFAEFDFSSNGTLAYRVGGPERLINMQWMDSAGKAVPIGIEPAYFMFPSLSPDGRRVAYTVSQESSEDLWIYDLGRGIKARLTTGQNTSYPIWSIDGQFVLYHATGGMFWARADGAGKPQPLTQSKAVQLTGSFTPDGKWLAYSEQIPEGGGELRIIPMENDSGQLRAGEPRVFVKTAVGLAFPAFSPDGRWLAYADAQGGRYEVYVRAFPDNGTQVQVSNAGGLQPIWSRTGHELFYRTEDQQIMVASYTVKGNSFVAEKPRAWSGRLLANMGLAANFDLSGDGKRFITLLAVENPEPREAQSHVMLVTNFFDEVRRRVAGQGK